MSHTMKDQVEKMLRKGWTSPMQAFHGANCLSLSQRAGELTKEGHNVQKDWLDLPTGKRVRIYRIRPK